MSHPKPNIQIPPPEVVPVPVDPKIWRAIIGSNFQIPPINSKVYYFPQSHIEHANSPLQSLNAQIFSQPTILCHVSALDYLCDPRSFEVFVKISLLPVKDEPNDSDSSLVVPNENEAEMTLSFGKVLTPSDVSKYFFNVPLKCAVDIFPPLDQGDQSRQDLNLNVTDVTGAEWGFRHIYNISHKKHVLTRNWSKFVQNKNFIDGDILIFIKDSTRKVFAGTRRAFKKPQFTVIDPQNNNEDDVMPPKWVEGRFARDGKGMCLAKDVSKAVELALKKKEFEVVYYPKMGWSDIVVKTEVVDKALKVEWTVGVRVKMERQTVDGLEMKRHQGTLTHTLQNHPWSGSRWRSLQVRWDEREITRTIGERVSPWEVELVMPRVATDIQGARQELSSVTNPSNPQVGNPLLDIGNTSGNMVPNMKTLTSTEPNGDKSHSKGLSLESPSSGTTIKLLGVDILVKQPVESGCMSNKKKKVGAREMREEVEGVDQ